MFNNLENLITEIIKKNKRAYAALEDIELRHHALELRKSLAGSSRLKSGPDRGVSADDEKLKPVLPAAFALAREAAFRELGFCHYREQLLAGIALYRGHLVQMQTGEGKTLAITAPAFLGALSGYKVHIVTSNDYLAERDCAAMGGVYTRLGLRCSVLTTGESFLWQRPAVPQTTALAASAPVSLPDPTSNFLQLQPCPRRQAYRADIIYGTASAFGFDYLRDHLVYRRQDLLNSLTAEGGGEIEEGGEVGTSGEARVFTILDEADNILLDEARTPLIISRPHSSPAASFTQAFQLVRRLRPAEDYEVDPLKKTAWFTDRGITRLEAWLASSQGGTGRALFGGEEDALYYLDNCLKALTLYHRDEDYLVLTGPTVADPASAQFPTLPSSWGSHGTYPSLREETGYREGPADNDNMKESGVTESARPGKGEKGGDTSEDEKLRKAAGGGGAERERKGGEKGELVLIDRLTGRPMPGRRLGNGLHEALEAREGLRIQAAVQVTATISLQSYFGLSGKLAGLSGSLATEKETFRRLYGLETVVIPPHRPVRRMEAPPGIFRTARSALAELLEAAVKVRESGAPVLIGTPSVSISEEVSHFLKIKGIPHQLLNARQNASEARVVARAGYPGRITVATNMAGRGTDILLGGRYADHLQDLARQEGLVREADEGSPAWQRLEEAAHQRHARARELVYGAGGLHVLGLGLQTSRRLDRQLVGRAGRQGDPGYSRFFYSLEDELVVKFAAKSAAYRRLVSTGSFSGGEIGLGSGDREGVRARPEQPREDEALSSSLAAKLIEECQLKAEGEQLDSLALGLEYDRVLHLQREIFYKDRRLVLLAPPAELRQRVSRLAIDFAEEGNSREKAVFDSGSRPPAYKSAAREETPKETPDRVREQILAMLDLEWVHYLAALEELRQGIGLRSFGTQKPLQAFGTEAGKLWQIFQSRIAAQLKNLLF